MINTDTLTLYSNAFSIQFGEDMWHKLKEVEKPTALRLNLNVKGHNRFLHQM